MEKHLALINPPVHVIPPHDSCCGCPFSISVHPLPFLPTHSFSPPIPSSQPRPLVLHLLLPATISFLPQSALLCVHAASWCMLATSSGVSPWSCLCVWDGRRLSKAISPGEVGVWVRDVPPRIESSYMTSVRCRSYFQFEQSILGSATLEKVWILSCLCKVNSFHASVC